MFLRSVITDTEKGPRPLAQIQMVRSTPNVNPGVITTRVNQPTGVSPNLSLTSGGEVEQQQLHQSQQQQSQPYIGTDEMDIVNKVDQQSQVSTDDGIKYAKMPPAQRPEKPKKVEKAKVTKPLNPQQLAYLQQQ